MSTEALKSLLDPPDFDAPDNILNKLNDDCLRSIFESSNLDHMDLWQLARVCHRFYDIAKPVFGVKYKNFEEFSMEIESAQWSFGELVCLFGSKIKSFGWSELNDIQCQLAAKHCPNVKKLICNISDQETIDGIRDFVVRLEKFYVTFSNAPMCMHDWFGTDTKLRRLIIQHYGDNYLRLPRGNLPALTELILTEVRLSGNEQFFRDNPQLQKLSLGLWFMSEWPFDFTCFGALKNLRSLTLLQSTDYTATTTMIHAFADLNIPLEDLCISFRQADTNQYFLNAISRIKSIKSLLVRFLRFDDNDQQAIRIAQNLPNLTVLSLSTEFHANALSGIKRLMDNAGEKLKKIHVYYDVVPRMFDDTPIMSEFDDMAMAARQRGIDMYLHYEAEHFDPENPNYLEETVSLSGMHL